MRSELYPDEGSGLVDAFTLCSGTVDSVNGRWHIEIVVERSANCVEGSIAGACPTPTSQPFLGFDEQGVGQFQGRR